MPNREQKRGTNAKTAERQQNRQNDQPVDRKRQGNGGRGAAKTQRGRGE